MKKAHFYCDGIIGNPSGDPEDSGQKFITVQSVRAFLASLDSSVEEIVFHINSIGGNPDAAYQMVKDLKASGKKIITIVEGKCYSAAPILMLAGDERIVTNDSILMLHAPWVKPEDETFTGDEMLSQGSALKSYENKMAATIVNATGANADTIKELMRIETFITPEKALELKLATKVSPPLKAFAFLKPNNSNQNLSQMEKTIIEKIGEGFNKLFAKLEIKAESTPAAAAKSLKKKTSDGSEITISDENSDGVPAIGDMVTDKDGNATPNATYTLEDGSTITTDADSKISAITPKAQAAATETAEVKALKEKLVKLEADKKAMALENAEYKASMEEFNNKLSLIVSAHIPKEGEQNFNSGETRKSRVKEAVAEQKK